MKRRVIQRRVVVFLLLLGGGAIVNVAVAWGCYLNCATSGQGNGPLFDVTERWPNLLRQVDFMDKSTTRYWILNRSGWPILSVESYAIVDFESTNPAIECRSGIVLEPHRGVWPEIRYPQILPLKPHLPGFAINTIFYAAILWVVFFVPGMVRRRIRRKRGLCPACAYPVGTSPVCTECGGPVGKRPNVKTSKRSNHGFTRMNTNSRRRIRSTIKWGGAVLTVLLLIVWVGSVGRVMVVGLAPTIIFGAIKGRAGIAWATPWTIVPNDFVASFDRERGSLDWWFEYEADRRETRILAPIWFLILSCATPSFLIWRRDRKRLPGTCPKCGYSRTGLPADRACPECGAAVTPR